MLFRSSELDRVELDWHCALVKAYGYDVLLRNIEMRPKQEDFAEYDMKKEEPDSWRRKTGTGSGSRIAKLVL